MPKFKIKQRVKHTIHGTGVVLKIEEDAIDGDVVTVLFDNDKERPLRLSMKHNSDTLIHEDF